MQSEAKSVEEYIHSLPEERKEAMIKLRELILKKLPKGFEETMGGMIHYVVPYSLYPLGYHCPPPQPLPFLSLANQKGNIALYHMGIYADDKLLHWFQSEWSSHSKRKLDMGKSCIRLKKMDDIPYDLIGDLLTKITPADWIATYEANYKPKK